MQATTMRDAFAEAGRLGHQWVGPEHVLLALLRDDRPSLAREVLNELGLTHSALERRWLATLVDTEPPLRSEVGRGASTASSPAWSRLDGWVEGFALASGRAPTPEDVLLGVCWAQRQPLPDGVTREAVLAALAARGVPDPAVAPPADEPLVSGERVDVPRARLDAVHRALLRAGRLVGFNVDADNDAAWVCIRPGDTEARALIDAQLDPGPPPR